jgi:hypothetical protein
MEVCKDKGKQEEEPLEPIMMDDDQIKWILASIGKTCSGVPYQYKMNTKKRVVALREGLVSDEEEVEYLWVVEKIEEILRATYERKTRGPRIGEEGSHPIHINVSVEPINPCATNTPKITPRLENQSSEEVRQQEAHLHKEKQLEELVQAALVKYLHHVEEVVVSHSEWQETTPLSDY